MKNTRTYNFLVFLRIILTAVLIFSIVFGLCKKVGLCASGGVGEFIYTKYPLPVGQGWGYGGQLTGEIVSDMINDALLGYPDAKLICVTNVWDSNEMTVNVYTSFTSIVFSGDINDLDNPSSIRYAGGGVGLDYRVNLGGYTGIEYSMGSGSCIPSNYVTQGPTQGDVYLIKNVYIPYYPLYISPDVDPSIYNLYFTLGEDSGGDASSIYISGHSVGGGTIDFDSFTYDSNGQLTGGSGSIDINLDVDLDTSGFEESLGDIQDSIETVGGSIKDSVDSVGGKLDTLNGKSDTLASKLEDIKGKLEDIKGKLQNSLTGHSWLQDIFGKLQEIYGKLSSLYDYITEPFNQQRFNSGVQALPAVQDISSIKSSVNGVVNSFNVSPDSGSGLIFQIPFDLPFVNLHQVATIDFTWYENIRDIVVPFMVAFVCFGMVWSLIRSIPGIIHGSSPDGDS